MKNMVLIMPIVVFVLFLAGNFWVFQKIKPVMVAPVEDMVQRIRIDLNEKQNRELQISHAVYRLHNAMLEAQIQVEKAKLEAEIDQPRPNIKKIDLLCYRIGALYGKKMNLRLSNEWAVEHKILSPDQWSELEDFPTSQMDKRVALALSPD